MWFEYEGIVKQQALPFLDISCLNSYELTSNPFAPVTASKKHPFRNLVFTFFSTAQCLEVSCILCIFEFHRDPSISTG